MLDTFLACLEYLHIHKELWAFPSQLELKSVALEQCDQIFLASDAVGVEDGTESFNHTGPEMDSAADHTVSDGLDSLRNFPEDPESLSTK